MACLQAEVGEHLVALGKLLDGISQHLTDFGGIHAVYVNPSGPSCARIIRTAWARRRRVSPSARAKRPADLGARSSGGERTPWWLDRSPARGFRATGAPRRKRALADSRRTPWVDNRGNRAPPAFRPPRSTPRQA